MWMFPKMVLYFDGKLTVVSNAPARSNCCIVPGLFWVLWFRMLPLPVPCLPGFSNKFQGLFKISDESRSHSQVSRKLRSAVGTALWSCCYPQTSQLKDSLSPPCHLICPFVGRRLLGLSLSEREHRLWLTHSCPRGRHTVSTTQDNVLVAFFVPASVVIGECPTCPFCVVLYSTRLLGGGTPSSLNHVDTRLRSKSGAWPFLPCYYQLNCVGHREADVASLQNSRCHSLLHKVTMFSPSVSPELGHI
jgi:hypothetical protein